MNAILLPAAAGVTSRISSARVDRGHQTNLPRASQPSTVGDDVTEPEVWLRGPLVDVPPLFQPVAHSLLQCREEVRECLPRMTRDQVWARTGDSAAIGYHVRHAIGSLDRLLTYARGEQLSDEQLASMRNESDASRAPRTPDDLVAAFDAAVQRAIAQVGATPPDTAFLLREVGRGRLPSTVLGLLFHAAEHTQRHIGQVATLVKVAGIA